MIPGRKCCPPHPWKRWKRRTSNDPGKEIDYRFVFSPASYQVTFKGNTQTQTVTIPGKQARHQCGSSTRWISVLGLSLSTSWWTQLCLEKPKGREDRRLVTFYRFFPVEIAVSFQRAVLPNVHSTNSMYINVCYLDSITIIWHTPQSFSGVAQAPLLFCPGT